MFKDLKFLPKWQFFPNLVSLIKNAPEEAKLRRIIETVQLASQFTEI